MMQILVYTAPMAKRVGNITVPGDVGVRKHEMETARALANAGHDVVFLKKSDHHHVQTPDILIDGVRWEMKAPEASNARAVQRNLHRALQQAPRVVFDGRRMKNYPDRQIIHELRKWLPGLKSCKGLKFVNRAGEVIDIK